MATSYHQPHKYKLVGGWKLVFRKKRVVAGPFMNQFKKFRRVKGPKFQSFYPLELFELIHKRPGHDPFFAENQFSPADEFVFMGLRICHFDVTACAKVRRLDNKFYRGQARRTHKMTTIKLLNKKARKLSRWNSYPWNLKLWPTDWLTHSLTNWLLHLKSEHLEGWTHNTCTGEQTALHCSRPAV